MNRRPERPLIRIARVVGTFYAVVCCWLPVIWLLRDQRETYTLHQYEFLGLPWWDEIALVILGLLALMGSFVLLLDHRR